MSCSSCSSDRFDSLHTLPSSKHGVVVARVLVVDQPESVAGVRMKFSASRSLLHGTVASSRARRRRGSHRGALRLRTPGSARAGGSRAPGRSRGSAAGSRTCRSRRGRRAPPCRRRQAAAIAPRWSPARSVAALIVFPSMNPRPCSDVLGQVGDHRRPDAGLGRTRRSSRTRCRGRSPAGRCRPPSTGRRSTPRRS